MAIGDYNYIMKVFEVARQSDNESVKRAFENLVTLTELAHSDKIQEKVRDEESYSRVTQDELERMARSNVQEDYKILQKLPAAYQKPGMREKILEKISQRRKR